MNPAPTEILEPILHIADRGPTVVIGTALNRVFVLLRRHYGSFKDATMSWSGIIANISDIRGNGIFSWMLQIL